MRFKEVICSVTLLTYVFTTSSSCKERQSKLSASDVETYTGITEKLISEITDTDPTGFKLGELANRFLSSPPQNLTNREKDLYETRMLPLFKYLSEFDADTNDLNSEEYNKTAYSSMPFLRQIIDGRIVLQGKQQNLHAKMFGCVIAFECTGLQEMLDQLNVDRSANDLAPIQYVRIEASTNGGINPVLMVPGTVEARKITEYIQYSARSSIILAIAVDFSKSPLAARFLSHRLQQRTSSFQNSNFAGNNCHVCHKSGWPLKIFTAEQGFEEAARAINNHIDSNYT